jgi:LysR family glycine cleavage system transcriptional activator
MQLPRRYLPPTPVLAAFEAAARLGSFTAAGAELHLTQSAISRQIRALEELLGAPLFVRERQTVRLTEAGEGYAAEIREALLRISQATLAFRANPQGGTLNVAILPTFGTRWLAPRLPRFFAAHPGVTVNLSTRLAPFDFRTDPLDAAIHFGAASWPGAELEPLMGESVVPACNPRFARQQRIRKPRDLLKVPLIHVASRPTAWAAWFAAQGVEVGGVPGMVVDQFATAAQTAMAGLGVALLPQFLMTEEFERGDLVAALPDAAVEGTERYYLAWPASRANHPPLVAFRGWLRGEVQDEGALPS